MKKIFLCVFMLFLVFAGCRKQHEKTATDRHWKFIFLEKKQIFPDITGLDTLHAFFEYYNNTGKPQTIDTVKTTCGCTKLSYPHKIIKAGEHGKVRMSVRVSPDAGYVTQSACVYFHGQKPVLLRVIGRKKMNGTEEESNAQ